MENLLKNHFTIHYGQPISTVAGMTMITNEPYFELEDDNRGNILLHTKVGMGMARYSNPQKISITIINYDTFFTSLSHSFQQGKKRCDLIVYSTNSLKYFLLNELKNRDYREDVRQSAVKQLLESLKTIIEVKIIQNFIDNYDTKMCCIFNKQPHSPIGITATAAFSRLSSVVTNGFKMSNPDIESYGFELWEFPDNQIYLLKDRPLNIESMAEQLSKLSTKEVDELAGIIQLKLNNNTK